MSFRVVGIGEVLWDMLPTGPQLGGAPTNFACHAQALGAHAHVVTRVGDDRLGGEVAARFKEMNLPYEAVQVDDANPTGVVEVTLNDTRVPQFTISENAAWDFLEVTSSALQAVRGADAVCFGSLAQRNPGSRASIHQLLSAVPVEALRVFDINLRQNFYCRQVIEQSFHLANALKLNDAELSVLTEMFGLRGGVRSRIEYLAETFGLKLVVLTCGADGSLIFKEGRWSEHLPQPVQVVDSVGAGDAFTAALVMGLLNKMDIVEIHTLAADVAAYVCSQSGATPPLPNAIRGKFTEQAGRKWNSSSDDAQVSTRVSGH